MFAQAHGFKAHSTNYILNKINIYYTKTAHCKQETKVSGGSSSELRKCGWLCLVPGKVLENQALHCSHSAGKRTYLIKK